jgi:hypothetical protein
MRVGWSAIRKFAGQGQGPNPETSGLPVIRHIQTFGPQRPAPYRKVITKEAMPQATPTHRLHPKPNKQQATTSSDIRSIARNHPAASRKCPQKPPRACARHQKAIWSPRSRAMPVKPIRNTNRRHRFIGCHDTSAQPDPKLRIVCQAGVAVLTGELRSRVRETRR